MQRRVKTTTTSRRGMKPASRARALKARRVRTSRVIKPSARRTARRMKPPRRRSTQAAAIRRRSAK